jgi:hypothetical protein
MNSDQLRQRGIAFREERREARGEAPPPDPGLRVGTISEADGEIRLTLQGDAERTRLSVRKWRRLDRGVFWPTSGLSIHAEDLALLAEAVAEAMDATADFRRQSQSTFLGARRRR